MDKILKVANNYSIENAFWINTMTLGEKEEVKGKREKIIGREKRWVSVGKGGLGGFPPGQEENLESCLQKCPKVTKH